MNGHRKHTPEQVVHKLREADKLLAEGKSVEKVAKDLEVSENTFHRWRNQYGGMKAAEAKELRLWGSQFIGGQATRSSVA